MERRKGDSMAGIIRRGESAPARTVDPFEMIRELMGWEPLREMIPAAPGAAFTPCFDVKESKGAFIFRADLPGVKEDDLELSLTGERLTISGKREEEKQAEDERFFSSERTYGNFSRSFTLPSGIDADHIRADLKDGVLSVIVPKKPEVQPRRIELKGEVQRAKA
jgi:HSP20 family protein